MSVALISPIEPRETGYRVAEVANAPFEVAPPLFWVECADDIVADVYWYDFSNGAFVLVPTPPEPEQPTVSGAQTL